MRPRLGLVLVVLGLEVGVDTPLHPGHVVPVAETPGHLLTHLTVDTRVEAEENNHSQNHTARCDEPDLHAGEPGYRGVRGRVCCKGQIEVKVTGKVGGEVTTWGRVEKIQNGC